MACDGCAPGLRADALRIYGRGRVGAQVVV